MNSIAIRKGAKPIGEPAGINIAKKSDLWLTKPNRVTPMNILRLIPKVITM
jgi:hypothetical protein